MPSHGGGPASERALLLKCGCAWTIFFCITVLLRLFIEAETAKEFSHVLEPRSEIWTFWIFLFAPGMAAMICSALKVSVFFPWYMLVGGLPGLLMYSSMMAMGAFNVWFLRDTLVIPGATLLTPLWLFIGFMKLMRWSSRQRESVAWRTVSILLYTLYAGFDLVIWFCLLPL